MDVDIDFPTNFNPTTIFPQAVTASMVKNGELVKHPCGQYFQPIPVDGVTSLAAIPYEEAEVLGYIKIDFLHLYILDSFSSKDEIRRLMAIEPDWSLLLHRQNVEKLFQLHNHYDLLQQIQPTSVQELADCITLIRPAKRHLIPQYVHNRKQVRDNHLYQRSGDAYAFKRSHAISYALTIVLQLHLIAAGKI
jgi:DNA polymerase III alpha subunit